jgi:hypothetical protein
VMAVTRWCMLRPFVDDHVANAPNRPPRAWFLAYKDIGRYAQRG